MSAEIEPIEAQSVQAIVPSTLFRTDDPAAVVRRATDVAKALSAVIEQQKLYVNIQGKKHVKVEGWTLLGSMLGVFPVCEWTHPLLKDGKPCGWEARVEAKTLAGAVVGAAEAECERGEKMWSGRDEYALRSMAQTRATSKALRIPLGFVMTLAGYDATPAEEVPAGGFNDRLPPKTSEEAGTTARQTEAASAPAPRLATPEQVKRMGMLFRKEYGPSLTREKALLAVNHILGREVQSRKELTFNEALSVIAVLERVPGFDDPDELPRFESTEGAEAKPSTPEEGTSPDVEPATPSASPEDAHGMFGSDPIELVDRLNDAARRAEKMQFNGDIGIDQTLAARLGIKGGKYQAERLVGLGKGEAALAILEQLAEAAEDRERKAVKAR